MQLSGPAEFERDVAYESPEVELRADKLRPVVETDGFRTADFLRRTFKNEHHVSTSQLYSSSKERNYLVSDTVAPRQSGRANCKAFPS